MSPNSWTNSTANLDPYISSYFILSEWMLLIKHVFLIIVVENLTFKYNVYVHLHACVFEHKSVYELAHVCAHTHTQTRIPPHSWMYLVHVTSSSSIEEISSFLWAACQRWSVSSKGPWRHPSVCIHLMLSDRIDHFHSGSGPCTSLFWPHVYLYWLLPSLWTNIRVSTFITKAPFPPLNQLFPPSSHFSKR